MRSQPISSKLAEVSYRSKIANQHLGSQLTFSQEPNARQFQQILQKRLQKATKTFSQLRKRNITLSPFLEIGAEYALASSLLASKFAASGFATDISFHSLAKTKEFAQKFNFQKVPQVICADATNLPLKSNSFPFVFIYETLHHFPDPKPVLAEIYRVLAPGGVCLVGGDPIAQTIQIKIWRRPTNLRLWEKILKFTLILPFISHIGKTEVEHGILEEAFSLKVWQKSLSIFEKVETTIETPVGIIAQSYKSAQRNWLMPNPATKIAIALFGGGLRAFCFKLPNRKGPPPPKNLLDLLVCPNCLANLRREISLSKVGVGFACPTCQISYKKYQQVPILLEPKLTKLLYL